MARLRKDVQVLKNLVTFEAASRSRNFTKAAEELGVTRVAVSRQIAELEQSLGQSLFVRGNREVTLTSAGEAFAKHLNPALERIADALERQRGEVGRSRLSVTVTASFATFWLMPRLVDFGAKHPDIELNLVVSDRYLDLVSEGIDIAIRFLPEMPVEGDWRPVVRETIIPVFSPHYRAQGALASPRDLARERLLYLSGVYRAEAHWGHWFRRQGLTPPEEARGLRVNTYINMLQAAIEGQGIALAGHPLVDRHLAEGTLRSIPSIAPLPTDCFYLYCRSDDAKTTAFRDWLLAQFPQSTD